MFLRVIRSLDKTIKFSGIRFSRFISQAAPNPIVSRTLPKLSDVKLATDAASLMKLTVLKRIPRKKPAWKATNISNQRDGQYFNVCAFATADWYDLDRLKQRLSSSSIPFQLIPLSEVINDVLCIQIRTETAPNSEVFIFDDGAVVFWNVQKDHEKILLNEVNKIKQTFFLILCFFCCVCFD
jgi:uncharacterized Rmd1/YagE family protein